MPGGALGAKKGSGLFIVAVLLVVQIATWRGRLRLQVEPFPTGQALQKRSLFDDVLSLGRNASLEFNDDLLRASNKKKKKDNKHQKNSSSSSSHPHATETSPSSVPASNTASSTTTTSQPSCTPLPTVATPDELCLHVRNSCPPSGHLDYLQFFYCIGLDATPASFDTGSLPTTAPITALQAPIEFEEGTAHAQKKPKHPKHPILAHGLSTRVKTLRVLALVAIIAWMLFLFSWVGIVASDFFCPNLSTLAARLGLSESTAGVTFLAFGNGSPDVFSTFGAMRTGSGSLAIGELIGAASFIVSVISGSMMLIAPFRVKPFPFLRDVGFFTVAVAMTLSYLFDGILRFGECVSLIALYLLYAATIIVGTWWQERRRLHRLRLANIRNENGMSESAQDLQSDDTEGQTLFARTSPYLGPRSAVEYEPDADPFFARWMENPQHHFDNSSGEHLSPHSAFSSQVSPVIMPTDLPTCSSANSSNARSQRFRNGILARHSLLGAVEFRDVVENLRRGMGADRSMEIYQSRDPERYLPHNHAEHRHQSHIGQIEGRLTRQHSRAKSLQRPLRRRTSSPGAVQASASMLRTRSTIGASADAGPFTDAERPTIEQIGQSSRLAAAAAAVADPWREHGPADGCDGTLLPPPALSPNVPDATRGDLQSGRNKQKLSLDTSDILVRPGSTTLDDEMASMPREAGQPMKKSDSYQSLVASSKLSVRRALTSKTVLRSVRRALFPSLRHIREKSWLGLAVGVITAPAILLLNLTLPVVDDEAEKALMPSSSQSNYTISPSQSGSGRIRLEGSEAPLRARSHSQHLMVDREGEDEEEDGEEGFGRGVINLSGRDTSNPWDASPGLAQEERRTAENRRDNLEVASALRGLPSDASPLLSGDGIPEQARKRHRISDADDAESCMSADSHVATDESRLLLGVAQCVFAPPFCVWTITSSAHAKHVYAKTFSAFVCGATVGFIALMIALRMRKVRHPSSIYGRVVRFVGWARVAMGFFVSILYIMTIVDEVVSILQTLGLVLGLSDAILGLTVFAMGNSLGDLVANITIARMGHPVMAISACFAGPLLNLLLGIGISGSYLLYGPASGGHAVMQGPGLQTWHDPGVYHIDFSPTLTVSGCGLLVILVGTLICVPLNGFYLNRTIGTTLIASYLVIMVINIGVEVYNLGS